MLLDTHVWLWVAEGAPQSIRPQTLEAIEKCGRSGNLLVSIVSVWEMALLEARLRLALRLPLRDWVEIELERSGIRLVALAEPATVIDSVTLPRDCPKDPADRFLIATAREHGATLVTRDERILAFAKSHRLRVMEA